MVVRNVIAALAALLLASCYAEWDVPKTPRRDPCTRIVEYKLVYVYPTCPYPPPPDPPAGAVK